jgi:hypothetical protein
MPVTTTPLMSPVTIPFPLARAPEIAPTKTPNNAELAASPTTKPAGLSVESVTCLRPGLSVSITSSTSVAFAPGLVRFDFAGQLLGAAEIRAPDHDR